MFGYGIQVYRVGGGRDNRGSITIQIPGAADGAFRR